jgi:glucan phosphoethanolaminetransferase (alkaline phosphatase superfamily)
MRQYHAHSVEQEVEWLYAFDVHANAFFCSFLVTYVLQVIRCVFFILFCRLFVCLLIASRLLIKFFVTYPFPYGAVFFAPDAHW